VIVEAARPWCAQNADGDGSMHIKDRHVLVTGGSQGIGVEIAKEFSRRGAAVTVLGRDAARLRTVAESINGDWFSLDLADESAVADAIGRVEAAHGPVDILVNNAALALVRGAGEYDPGDAKRLMMVNSIAPMELVRQVLPGMFDRGRGHIVNISSLSGVSAVPDMAIYCASKAALHHYTAVLQRELRRDRSPVGATLVTLGEVAGTHMMEQARQSPIIAAVSARLARSKILPMITPADAARAIADAVHRDAQYAAVPRRLAAIIGLRNLPSRLQDVALIGLKARATSAVVRSD
jgi:short-subunit dehydrogenase